MVNQRQVDKAIKLGVALGCQINELNFFDRKHYFYPDLPKGYQITQDNEPICIGGSLTILVDGKEKVIKIHHIHMEEDAGKTVHDMDEQYSLVDLNRAGTPLLELVTEPDLASPEEVYQFISELQKLLRYIDVSDADMEKGSMRCDCNVSVKPIGSPTLGERCEIKNLNSKRFAREAVTYEAKRQIDLLEAGETISMQTRHYDVDKKITLALRDKEGAEDYRYLPDPDLAPIRISKEKLDSIIQEMPKMPWEVKKDLTDKHHLQPEIADLLISSPEMVDYFYELLEHTGDPRQSSNFMVNILVPHLQEQQLSLAQSPISVRSIVAYLALIKQEKVTASIANQRLWPAMIIEPHEAPDKLAQKLGIMINTDDSFIDDLISTVLDENPAQVAQYKKGKKNLIGFFVGAIMKKSKGSANPKALQQKLKEKLDS